uniref:Uncharacterized protein n=1 Tax=Nelumbo nucifera TaxID=4432 RepID=A0A822ZIS7_NELNU|nr:TPA_asm: hypothetical protein HUJ06_001605 [Nelumbo nucifera]
MKREGKFECDDNCCVIESSSDDGAHGDEYGEEWHGDADGLEIEGDVANEGFESECDELDVKGDVSNDDGGGVQDNGVQCDTSVDGEVNKGGNEVTTVLSDYEPASDCDSPCDDEYGFRRGKDSAKGPYEFDFSKLKFLVDMVFANVKEFREAL